MELLIAFVLFILIGSLVFWVLVKALRSVASTAAEAKQSSSVAINTDWLAFDLKHVGYGISLNETSIVLSYCNGSGDPLINPACAAASSVNPVGNKLLLLKETTNVADTECSSDDPDFGIGFVLWNGTAVAYQETPCDVCGVYKNQIKCEWETTDRIYLGSNICCQAPSADLAVGYPIDTDSACISSTNKACCQNQKCTGILWYLKPTTTSINNCFNGTYVLYRKTTASDGGFEYAVPIISCVSDWDIWFYIDTDNDGVPDTWLNEIPDGSYITNNDDLHNKLKLVKIYLLVQASYSPDPNYDFCKLAAKDCDNTCGNGYILADVLKDADGKTHLVCLKHPDNPDWVHYRWKIVTLPVDNFPDIP